MAIFRRFASKPARFSSLIDGKVAGSTRPENETQIKWLWTKGIRAIVCLNMEHPLDNDEVQNYGFEYAFIPVRDFSAPTIQHILEFVNFVDKMLEHRNPVVVSCGAGIGRTGTMLAAYLISKCYSPEKALEEVKENEASEWNPMSEKQFSTTQASLEGAELNRSREFYSRVESNSCFSFFCQDIISSVA